MKLKIDKYYRWFFIELSWSYKITGWDSDCYPEDHEEYEGDSICFENKFFRFSINLKTPKYFYWIPVKIKYDGHYSRLWHLWFISVRWGEEGYWIGEDYDEYPELKELATKQGMKKQVVVV